MNTDIDFKYTRYIVYLLCFVFAEHISHKEELDRIGKELIKTKTGNQQINRLYFNKYEHRYTGKLVVRNTVMRYFSDKASAS